MGTYDAPFIVKVAEMYYYRNISQKDIGKLLNLSPAKVSRILKEAVDTGIVKIKITSEAIDFSELNEKIKKMYNLQSVNVVNIPIGCEDSQRKKILGQAAKIIFIDAVEPNCIVGIGVGETIGEMVASFKVNEIPYNINLVPLMGGWSSSKLNSETNNLIYNLANILGCEYNSLLAPAILSDIETKERLFKEPEIKIVTDLWRKLDMAIFSIGPKISQGEHKNIYPSEQIKDIAGDLLGWAINSNGTLAELEINNRLFSIPIDLLKKVPKRIAIGGGINKCLNINAVLKGGLATHLITDYDTALYILNNGGHKNENA